MDESEYARTLADELLGDIELSRIPADQLALKASRLARLVNHDELLALLVFELNGYTRSREAEKYMDWTGRWIDKEKGTAWWAGLGSIEGVIDAQEKRLEGLSMPSLSGDGIVLAAAGIQKAAAGAANTISRLGAIRGKVIALIHRHVTDIYHQLEFSSKQESIFEHAKLRVDALLAPVVGETLTQIEAIYRRLSRRNPRQSATLSQRAGASLTRSPIECSHPRRPGSLKVVKPCHLVARTT
ncbi:MAG: hypothetical protein WD739_11405 [Actinomycetota bacterium]